MSISERAGKIDFCMPFHACDCHTHIFENEERFPFSPDRTYTPNVAALDGLLSHLKRCRLERVVIVQPSPYGSDNSCLLDALQQIPETGRGVAVIDRNISDDELQLMHESGVRGVRINLQTHGINDPAYAAVELKWAASRVVNFGWHIQLFTNPRVLADLKNTILSLPTSVVIDHFGQAEASLGTNQEGFPALIELVKQGVAWVKLSAAQRISNVPDCADVEPIVRALCRANPERLLWGSDWPHPGARMGRPRSKLEVEPFNDVDDIQALNRLASWVDSNHLQKILVDNPNELYGFNF